MEIQEIENSAQVRPSSATQKQERQNTNRPVCSQRERESNLFENAHASNEFENVNASDEFENAHTGNGSANAFDTRFECFKNATKRATSSDSVGNARVTAAQAQTPTSSRASRNLKAGACQKKSKKMPWK